MDAIVTIQFKIPSVCHPNDLENQTFQQLVEDIIESEGIFGVVDAEDFKVVEIREDSWR